MDTGILNVLPVQATLISEILLKLLLNETHRGQPAGARGKRVGSEMRGHGAGEGPRLARTVGMGTSFWGSHQSHQRRLAGCWSGVGKHGARWATWPPETGPTFWAGQGQRRPALELTPQSSQSSHIGKLSPCSFPCSSPVRAIHGVPKARCVHQGQLHLNTPLLDLHAPALNGHRLCQASCGDGEKSGS